MQHQLCPKLIPDLLQSKRFEELICGVHVVSMNYAINIKN